MAARRVAGRPRQQAKPFDATTKTLVETHPEDWLALAGLPPQPVLIIDADLATVTTEADRVLRVGDPPVCLLHFEFESGESVARIGDRSLRYNVLLDGEHNLPVLSVVVLLRRESNSPRITGRVERYRPDGTVYLTFDYRVVRVWEMDAEALLTGGLGTLPLAPIANISTERLPEAIRRMDSRIQTEAATPNEAAQLWAATYLLMGLKYPSEFAAQLLRGIEKMRESTTYQSILAEGRSEGRSEGRAAEARGILLRLAEKRFGAPSVAVSAAIQAISPVERLEQMIERVLEVESWDELLMGA